MCEEQWYVDRVRLRDLMQAQPARTQRERAEQIGRSLGWVKKWAKRIRQADPDDACALRSRSRARHHPPEKTNRAVVERILAIRDAPPGNLQRVPGPRTILYYLAQDEALKQLGVHIPTSTSTIWKILDDNDRIIRRRARPHEPLERPAPMVSFGVDFKDVSTVPPDPNGKQQHVVESLNVVDAGTSVLVDAIVRDDFTSETAIRAMTGLFHQYGLPDVLTFDRDSRFVGSWSGQDFPAPFVRFLHALGITPSICPPRRPDKNPFAERFNGNYHRECLMVHRPDSLDNAQAVTAAYKTHYNFERPSQALTCHNQPPRSAFPQLPRRRPLPLAVHPDAWLHASDGTHYTRRVRGNGTVVVDRRAYYVQRGLAGQTVTLHVDAPARALVIEHRGQVIKRVAIKGLYETVIDFADYLELICAEARDTWRLTKRLRRRATM